MVLYPASIASYPRATASIVLPLCRALHNGNYVELGVMWRNGHPLQLKGQMAVKLVYITMIPISFV